MILMRPIIQEVMQLLLILQMIMRLVNKIYFLKIMINGVKIDHVEDLDVVMPMYNLREYSKDY